MPPLSIQKGESCSGTFTDGLQLVGSSWHHHSTIGRLHERERERESPDLSLRGHNRDTPRVTTAGELVASCWAQFRGSGIGWHTGELAAMTLCCLLWYKWRTHTKLWFGKVTEDPITIKHTDISLQKSVFLMAPSVLQSHQQTHSRNDWETESERCPSD